MDEAKAILLYNFFNEEGYDLGGEQDFLKALGNDFKRKELYEFFDNEGYDVGTLEDFHLKKKDVSQLPGERDITESDTEVQEDESGSSESPVPQFENEETTPEVTEEEEVPTEETQTPPEQPEVFEEKEEEFQFEEETPDDIETDIVEEDTVTEEVMYDPKEKGESPDATITYASDATPFQRSLAYITPELIDREEEEVVNRMDYHFGDYGFEFSERGMGDAMRVKAYNGKTLDVNLDPFTNKTEKEEAEKLKKFLEANKRVTPEIDDLINSYDQSRKKYFSRQAVENDIQSIRTDAADLSNRYKNYLGVIVQIHAR